MIEILFLGLCGYLKQPDAKAARVLLVNVPHGKTVQVMKDGQETRVDIPPHHPTLVIDPKNNVAEVENTNKFGASSPISLAGRDLRIVSGPGFQEVTIEPNVKQVLHMFKLSNTLTGMGTLSQSNLLASTSSARIAATVTLTTGSIGSIEQAGWSISMIPPAAGTIADLAERVRWKFETDQIDIRSVDGEHLLSVKLIDPSKPGQIYISNLDKVVPDETPRPRNTPDYHFDVYYDLAQAPVPIPARTYPTYDDNQLDAAGRPICPGAVFEDARFETVVSRAKPPATHP